MSIWAIRRLLPEAVRAVELRDDPPDVALFPEEEAHIAHAVAKRRDEFATVRHCARLALHELGVERAPLLPGEAGAPTWPPEIVGSMTHCPGYRAAAVARSSKVIALGIDAEPDEPLPDKILPLVTSAAEREHIAAMTKTTREVRWDRLLFSAKETLYKAWYPTTHRWLGFDDVDVQFNGEGQFCATLLTTSPMIDGVELRIFGGRWLSQDGLVLTSIVVPRDPSTTQAPFG